MYRHHFGLQSKPFQIVPNPRLLYASETHDEGRARILYGIREGRGFVVVTGGVGLGKTTVLLSVLEELDARVRTALIFNPVDTYPQLMRMLAHEFGLPSAGRDEVDLLHELNSFFVERLAKGETCVLIIDEAQNLSIELLERVRTLSNLQTDHSFLLQVVLVGQPELTAKLLDPRLVQLRQRVGIWHEIRPLRQDETEDYILHRLRMAGSARPKEIIPPKVCAKVHALARGVPRVVNQLCDTALLIAFGRDARNVAEDHVEEAARELRLTASSLPRPAERPADQPGPAPSGWGRAWRRALLAAFVLLAIGAGALLRQSEVRAFLSRIDWPWTSAVGAPVGSSPAADSGRVAQPSEAASPTVEPAPATLAAGLTGATLRRPAVQDPDPAIPRPDDLGALGVEPVADPHREVASRRAEIAAWRQSGEVVYSVHLGSFLTLVRAREFAAQLAAGGDWAEPLYVERTTGEPAWYRVLAGGFRDAESARVWIRESKLQRGLAYGQLSRLAPGAEELAPAVPTAATRRESSTGVEG
jgi:general secretion pathway protein A